MEMPKIYVNPPRSEWPALTARCTRQEEEIGERVAAILAEVRTRPCAESSAASKDTSPKRSK